MYTTVPPRNSPATSSLWVFPSSSIPTTCSDGTPIRGSSFCTTNFQAKQLMAARTIDPLRVSAAQQRMQNLNGGITIPSVFRLPCEHTGAPLYCRLG